MTDREVDHAIIGGGIAGLYCCYHLKDKIKNARIELFEASDRLGGRIETWRIDPRLLREHIQSGASAQVRVCDLLGDGNANRGSEKPARPPAKPGDLMIAEFGPMRIEPDHQPYLRELLTRLGITAFDGSQEKWTDLIPFPPYQGPPPDEPQFTLEDEEALQTTLVDLLLLALRRSFEVSPVRRHRGRARLGEPLEDRAALDHQKSERRV